MHIRGLERLRDPLSVDNELFYTFYRTLKRWTTETWDESEKYVNLILEKIFELDVRVMLMISDTK